MPGRIKLSKQSVGYLSAVLGMTAITGAFLPFQARVNATTVALALLLVVLFIATGWGSRPALLASLFGMVYFNYFFLPPFRTLTIADPENWVALVAFLITAVTAGELSARAQRRAEEAEVGRREIERLYHHLQSAFERESQAEALRRSEQLKSALLDAVTHDLRTPLTSIKASVTTLLKEVQQALPVALGQEGQQEFLEVIDEETDRLSRDVESLIELARIEAGEMELRRRWVTIEEVIETAILRAGALTRHHRLEVSVGDQLPAVHADAQAIAEVIYALLDNATKYAPPQTRVLIDARMIDDEMVGVAVEDEGSGIPVESRRRVFEKFFRATGAGAPTPYRPAGIGMGLAIARGIIDAHAGRIWVEDGTGGKGTRVVFTLPIGEEESPMTLPGGDQAFSS